MGLSHVQTILDLENFSMISLTTGAYGRDFFSEREAYGRDGKFSCRGGGRGC